MLLIRILEEMLIRFWIDLVQDRVQWQTSVNTVMNLRGLNVSGYFLFRYLKLVNWIKFYSHQLMQFFIQLCISLLSYIKIT